MKYNEIDVHTLDSTAKHCHDVIGSESVVTPPCLQLDQRYRSYCNRDRQCLVAVRELLYYAID